MKAHGIRFGLICIVSSLCGGLVSNAAQATDQRWQADSNRQLYRVAIWAEAGRVEIGSLQSWRLTIEAIDGRAVDDARIVVGGGMPGHGHGLPTQPLVTTHLGDGLYVIEGIKLTMSGDWIIVLDISSSTGDDVARVPVRVGLWTDIDQELLQTFYLSAQLDVPESPSNRVADNDEAALLGGKLFFEKRLSAGSALSCASCHQPERYFTDNLARGQGVHKVGRNTPTVIGAAFQSWFYWDGRRDSLWSQALVPFEAEAEMGSSRTAVVRLVGSDPEYRVAYEKVFGSLPERALAAAIPKHAGPLGTSAMRDAWYRMKRSDTELINTIYANIGKSIAAYQRSLPIPSGSRFDRYVESLSGKESKDRQGLSRDELAGLQLFLDEERTHCLRCHNGPWFTNGEFHNIGTGNFKGPVLDFGRVYGLQALLADEFNCLGRYSDAREAECSTLRFLNKSAHVPLEGAFKVPGLRNLARTAPYMHDGRFESLSDVIEFYRSAGSEAQTHELPPLKISDNEARAIEAFLLTLTSPEFEQGSYIQ